MKQNKNYDKSIDFFAETLYNIGKRFLSYPAAGQA
jgi:hypothetical protein